jgi:hypothetical protein
VSSTFSHGLWDENGAEWKKIGGELDKIDNWDCCGVVHRANIEICAQRRGIWMREADIRIHRSLLPTSCKIYASAGAGFDWVDTKTMAEHGSLPLPSPSTPSSPPTYSN